MRLLYREEGKGGEVGSVGRGLVRFMVGSLSGTCQEVFNIREVEV